MNQRYVSLSKDIADEWDRLVEGSPDGWLFSLSAWQRLILAVEPWQLRDHSFAYCENGRLLGVMPLQRNSNSNTMSSSGWGGSGPVVAGHLTTSERARVLGILLDHARAIAVENGASRFDFSVLPVTQSSIAARSGGNPFILHGFTDASQITQVIDLSQDESALYESLDPDCRRLLRRASDARIDVRQVDWPEYLDAYYTTHQETYTRTGVPPHPKAYFAGIAHEIAPLGHSILFAAFSPAGAPIAFVNCSRFGSGATYHSGCSRGEALRIGANYALLWHAILSMRQAGCRWFEVGPIFPSTDVPKLKGLTGFKTKFGGEPHRFFRCEMPLPGAAAASADPQQSSTVPPPRADTAGLPGTDAPPPPGRPLWRRLLRRPGQIARRALRWRG